MPTRSLRREQSKGDRGQDNGCTGVSHIVALGDASASLCLIATLVYACGVSLMYTFVLTGTAANYVVCTCITGAPVCSSFVMSYALLEFYYAQMLKKRDDVDLWAHEEQRAWVRREREGDTAARDDPRGHTTPTHLSYTPHTHHRGDRDPPSTELAADSVSLGSAR